MQHRESLVRLTSLVLLAVVVISCASPGDGSSTPSQRRFLSVGTAPPGGAFFPVGGAIAEVINENAGDGKWEVTAEATKGSKENIRRLVKGQLDLALANAAITYFAVRGAGDWGEPQRVQAVMTLAPNVALFIAPADGDVKTIADLRGKRVYVGPAGAGFDQFIGPLLAAHGLTYDDFSPLNGTQTQAVEMLSDGSAAAAFLGGAVPTASITQAASTRDIRFLPFDEEARARLIREYSFFTSKSIPAGTYKGQDEEFAGLDVGSMHLITSTDADEELVYQLTRTIWENREQVVARHPAGKAINPGNAARDTGTSFHPGAVRFYREIGIWSE